MISPHEMTGLDLQVRRLIEAAYPRVVFTLDSVHAVENSRVWMATGTDALGTRTLVAVRRHGQDWHITQTTPRKV